MSSAQSKQLSLENALAILADVLSSVCPEELGESLTRTLRQLTGARCVLLLSHQEDWEADSRVYATPTDGERMFSSRELRLLCPLRQAAALPCKVADVPDDHPLRPILKRAGVTTLHQYPLTATGEHVGSVIIIDPPQAAGTDEVLGFLEHLLPLCALALRSLLCNERVVAQSRELAEYAEKLERDVADRSTETLDLRNRFAMLFDKAPVPLSYLDKNGRILEINESFTSTFGYTLDDMSCQETFWQAVYPDPQYRATSLVNWLRAMRRAIRSEAEVASIEHEVTCKNGQVRTVMVSGTAFGDHLLATYYDVTDQNIAIKALRRSEERFRQVAEQTREWIWEVDADGLFTYVSIAVQSILGYLPEEIVGQKYFYDLFCAEDRERLKTLTFEAFLNGESFTAFELRNLHRDGREIWLSASGSPFFDEAGLLDGYRGSYVDITESKQMDAERERLLQAIEQAGETVVITDIEGVVQYVNPAFERITGYSRGEILGKNINLIRGNDQDEDYYRDMWETISSGKVWRGKFINRRKKGTLYHEEATIAPIRDAAGLIVGFVSTKIDVTERIQADAERERLLQAIEQAGETIVITDPQGVVQYANPAFERVTGYARDEIVGTNMRTISSGVHDQAFYAELWDTISNGQVWQGQFVNRRKDGSLYNEEANIAPVRDAEGRIVNYVATKLDITERKKAETALLQKNAEMERFTYTVSHDLKSPLVTIKGFLGVLAEDLKRGDQEAIATDMTFIGDAADHMNNLLNELLQLSRIGRVVNPPEECRFRELIDDALFMAAGIINERSVEVSVDVAEVVLYADRRRISEAILNLVENAVKYMGPQPAPKIAFSTEKRDGSWVFCVQDNGIGVDPKYHEKIFGLFEKLAHDSKGTGIGLAIVKSIIELYDGRVWVESEGAGKGSCFCFTLPAAVKPKGVV